MSFAFFFFKSMMQRKQERSHSSVNLKDVIVDSPTPRTERNTLTSILRTNPTTARSRDATRVTRILPPLESTWRSMGLRQNRQDLSLLPSCLPLTRRPRLITPMEIIMTAMSMTTSTMKRATTTLMEQWRATLIMSIIIILWDPTVDTAVTQGTSSTLSRDSLGLHSKESSLPPTLLLPLPLPWVQRWGWLQWTTSPP